MDINISERELSDSNQPSSLQSKQLVITSPGTASLHVMSAIARGLKLPFTKAAAVYCRTPASLIKGLSSDEAIGLKRILNAEGLVTQIEDDRKTIEPPDLFEAALRVKNIEKLPFIIDMLGRFLGLDSEKVYQVLATTPSAIVGQVSHSTLSALANQLGESAELITAPIENSCYDLLWYSQDQLPNELKKCHITDIKPSTMYWLELGLSKEKTNQVFKRFVNGSRSRFVNRSFLRFDLLLKRRTVLFDELHHLFGIPLTIAKKVAQCEKIALSSELEYATAKSLKEEACKAGLEVELSIPELKLWDLEIETAPSKSILHETLQSLQLPVPSRLPESVAFDLVDLDARVLQHQLHSVGVKTRFIEAVANRQ